jgi:tRNA (mo5U34)-methyltransferase
MKIDFYSGLFNQRIPSSQTIWKDTLKKQLTDLFNKPSHGHFLQWLNTIDQLSKFHTNQYSLNDCIIKVGNAEAISNEDKTFLEHSLKSLVPWRKGPFNLFGIHIDSEWQCDHKWQRVEHCLTSLQNKTILDVGCGNGYYMLRMLGAGAKTVIGVDPTLIFLAQYTAITQYITSDLHAYLLPLPFEQLPKELNEFDVVFSMGVLYHRRDPIEHIKRLYAHTCEGGKLILETLVIDRPDIYELNPEQRYAGMRNVWSVPSPKLLVSWLHLCGYENIQLQNIQATKFDEQRATQWTKNFSLENVLDPENLQFTIEGYPAPVRAIFSAEKL